MMKKNRKNRNAYGEPNGRIVVQAVSGDIDSILVLLDFYRRYIGSLARISYTQEDGKEVSFYDDDLRDELYTKFIDATVMFSIRK